MRLGADLVVGPICLITCLKKTNNHRKEKASVTMIDNTIHALIDNTMIDNTVHVYSIFL